MCDLYKRFYGMYLYTKLNLSSTKGNKQIIFPFWLISCLSKRHDDTHIAVHAHDLPTGVNYVMKIFIDSKVSFVFREETH